MSTWTHTDLHKHMHVYSSDTVDLGHIAEVYKDSFLVRKGFFTKDKYIPYSAIASVNQDKVQLQLNAEAASETRWEVRPDYEDHLGDPTQLFYDRGHDVHDPFDETNSTKA